MSIATAWWRGNNHPDIVIALQHKEKLVNYWQRVLLCPSLWAVLAVVCTLHFSLLTLGCTKRWCPRAPRDQYARGRRKKKPEVSREFSMQKAVAPRAGLILAFVATLLAISQFVSIKGAALLWGNNSVATGGLKLLEVQLRGINDVVDDMTTSSEYFTQVGLRVKQYITVCPVDIEKYGVLTKAGAYEDAVAEYSKVVKSVITAMDHSKGGVGFFYGASLIKGFWACYLVLFALFALPTVLIALGHKWPTRHYLTRAGAALGVLVLLLGATASCLAMIYNFLMSDYCLDFDKTTIAFANVSGGSNVSDIVSAYVQCDDDSNLIVQDLIKVTNSLSYLAKRLDSCADIRGCCPGEQNMTKELSAAISDVATYSLALRGSLCCNKVWPMYELSQSIVCGNVLEGTSYLLVNCMVCSVLLYGLLLVVYFGGLLAAPPKATPQEVDTSTSYSSASYGPPVENGNEHGNVVIFSDDSQMLHSRMSTVGDSQWDAMAFNSRRDSIPMASIGVSRLSVVSDVARSNAIQAYQANLQANPAPAPVTVTLMGKKK